MIVTSGRWLNAIILLVATLIITSSAFKAYRDHDSSRCNRVMNDGRWSHDIRSKSRNLEWHPAGCVKPKHVHDVAIHECFKNAVLVGDSSARELYTELSKGWADHDSQSRAHSNLSVLLPTGKIYFLWDPYLNITHISGVGNSLSIANASIGKRHFHRFGIFAAGLHHARHLDNHSITAFTTNVRELLDSREGPGDLELTPVFLPVLPPHYSWLSHERALTITPNKIRRLNLELEVLAQKYGFEVLWAGIKATQDPTAFLDDGLHHKPFLARMQLEILAARLCPRAYDHSCCSKPLEIGLGQTLSIVTAAAIIVFYLFQRLLGADENPLLQSNAIVAAVILYCFVADRTEFFEKVTKLVDEQVFILLCGIAFVFGGLTVRRCREQTTASWSDEILPRQQTEEWKGWMQIVILLYHYFGMSQNLWVYRVVRLLVASYIFLTGYGHTHYFIQTKDFSLRRAMTVLLRTNLLAVWLSFVMGTHYQLYYFPLLTSFWFMIIWATIPSDGVTCLGWIRFGCSATLMGFVYGHQMLDQLFGLLSDIGMVSIEFKEFKFRIGLDFYAAYLGMAVAMLLAMMRQPTRNLHHMKLAVWIVAAGAFVMYFASAAGRNKGDFNRYHPVLSLMPIIGFIFMRNARPAWRSHYSGFFAWIGRHSLETFVLQYHIWLAADTEGVLHLGLVDRHWQERSTKGSWRFWFEVVLITGFFFWMCAGVSKASAVVVEAIMGARRADHDKESLGVFCTNDAALSSRLMNCWHELWVKCAAICLFLWALNYCWA